MGKDFALPLLLPRPKIRSMRISSIERAVCRLRLV